MENIKKIVERKKTGVDCTESESSEIKGFIKDNSYYQLVANDESETFKLIFDIFKLFPIECSEAIEEMEYTPEIVIEFGNIK